ncbi:MAG: STAS domain-containing protein [Planctomycetota bacterium]|nr:STAS domain-containing protein [Planctomycetota bacterium]
MPLEDFSIKQEPASKPGVTLVHVAGYLDAHTYEQLEETIAELFGKNLYKIVVDLAKVEYISSAGAGVFIGALSEAQEHGGNIVLMSPTSNVREVFDLLGLTQIFQVVDDQKAALAAF